LLEFVIHYAGRDQRKVAMLKHSLTCIVILGLDACALPNVKKPAESEPRHIAASVGENESGYTYIPIDPFPVQTVDGDGCQGAGSKSSAQLLDALPDNAVRMMVERYDVSGTVTYGTSKAGLKNESYRVTVDYINADTVNVPVWIARSMMSISEKKNVLVDMFEPAGSEYVPGSDVYEVRRDDSTTTADIPSYYNKFNIPVYVGIGLRVSANVYVVGATANISGIGIIGAEAEAERLRGSLVVQTLGVNGKSIAAALPIQSELNRTTAQNAIVAVGAIKALLYNDDTVKSPRVVGLYLPFPGGRPLVNALISELSKTRLKWERPCVGHQISATN
jgi:hypothetical protein